MVGPCRASGLEGLQFYGLERAEQGLRLLADSATCRNRLDSRFWQLGPSEHGRQVPQFDLTNEIAPRPRKGRIEPS